VLDRVSAVPELEGLRPARAVAAATKYLAEEGVDAPSRTAEILLMNVVSGDRAALYVREDGLTPTEARVFAGALAERRSGVPLQYVVGTQQFMDLVLEVRPGVFIPRPETEVLVGAAVQVLGGRTSPVAIDAGTGTGAIALAIRRRIPVASVFATDISESAVALARRNAAHLELEIEVLRGDLLDPIPPELRGHVDLITSNPPYVTAEEYESLPNDVRAEPHDAIIGGIEFHRRLVDVAPELLRPGGWLITEIGSDQGTEVSRLFRASLQDVDVLQDLAGRDRIVRGRVG
jgi:release factor glutamine methyltransferase